MTWVTRATKDVDTRDLHDWTTQDIVRRHLSDFDH